MPVWQSWPLTWQEEGMWSQALLSAAGVGSSGAEPGLRMDTTSRQSLLGDMGHRRLLGPPRMPPTSFLLGTALFLLGQPHGLCWNPLSSPQFFSFPLVLGKNSPSLPCFLLANLPLSSESFTKDLKPAPTLSHIWGQWKPALLYSRVRRADFSSLLRRLENSCIPSFTCRKEIQEKQKSFIYIYLYRIYK